MFSRHTRTWNECGSRLRTCTPLPGGLGLLGYAFTRSRLQNVGSRLSQSARAAVERREASAPIARRAPRLASAAQFAPFGAPLPLQRGAIRNFVGTTRAQARCENVRACLSPRQARGQAAQALPYAAPAAKKSQGAIHVGVTEDGTPHRQTFLIAFAFVHRGPSSPGKKSDHF